MAIRLKKALLLLYSVDIPWDVPFRKTMMGYIPKIDSVDIISQVLLFKKIIEGDCLCFTNKDGKKIILRYFSQIIPIDQLPDLINGTCYTVTYDQNPPTGFHAPVLEAQVYKGFNCTLHQLIATGTLPTY